MTLSVKGNMDPERNLRRWKVYTEKWVKLLTDEIERRDNVALISCVDSDSGFAVRLILKNRNNYFSEVKIFLSLEYPFCPPTFLSKETAISSLFKMSWHAGLDWTPAVAFPDKLLDVLLDHSSNETVTVRPLTNMDFDRERGDFSMNGEWFRITS